MAAKSIRVRCQSMMLSESSFGSMELKRILEMGVSLMI